MAAHPLVNSTLDGSQVSISDTPDYVMSWYSYDTLTIVLKKEL